MVLVTEFDFPQGLMRLLKESWLRVPRGLKSARQIKNKRLRRWPEGQRYPKPLFSTASEAEPFQIAFMRPVLVRPTRRLMALLSRPADGFARIGIAFLSGSGGRRRRGSGGSRSGVDRAPGFADLKNQGDLTGQNAVVVAELRVNHLTAQMSVEGGEAAGSGGPFPQVETALEELQDQQGVFQMPGAFLDGAAADGMDGALQIVNQKIVEDDNQAGGRSLLYGGAKITSLAGVGVH